MAKMYIANCTNQVQDFAYRTVENPKLMRQLIPIGGQIQLSGDLSTPDIEYVIRQHAHYGLIAVTEADRVRDYSGLCFSLDKPVNMNRVLGVVEKNFAVLEERGRQTRQEAAVAVNNQLADATPSFKALEMSIQEQGAKGAAVAGGVSEGIRVDPKAPPPSGAKPRNTARAPRRR